MMVIECEDSFWGDGFTTGNLLEHSRSGVAFEIALLVRCPKRRRMWLYVNA